MSYIGNDLPDLEPTIRIPLKWVGIKSIPYTIRFTPQFDGDPDPVYMACNVSLFSSLSKQKRGLHISRLSEVLIGEINSGPFSIFHFCKKLAEGIRNAERQDYAKVRLICKHTIQRTTPVTKKPTFIPLLLNAEFTTGPSGFTYKPSLELEIMMMCPCVVEMSKASNTRKRSRPESTIGFSHSQRAMMTLSVLSQKAIQHSELLKIAEKVAGFVSTTVKRPDELQIIQQALENPAFCEDIIRKALSLTRNHFRTKVLKAMASIESHESIHPFSIVVSSELSLQKDMDIARN